MPPEVPRMRRTVRLVGVYLALGGHLFLLGAGMLLRGLGEALCGLADRGYPAIERMLRGYAKDYDIST